MKVSYHFWLCFEFVDIVDGLDYWRAIGDEFCWWFVDKYPVCVVVEDNGDEWDLPQVCGFSNNPRKMAPRDTFNVVLCVS